MTENLSATLPARPHKGRAGSVKPGYATTEFWLVLVTSVVALLTALGVVGPDWAKEHGQTVQALALLGSTLAPAVYAVSRALVKKASVGN